MFPHVAILALFVFTACGAARSDTSPTEAVTTFAAAVEAAERDSTQRRRVYELLSQRGRRALDERAARATQVSGRPMAPWEMIAPGRIRLRFLPSSDGMTVHVDGDRAVVTARGRRGGVADVPLVREGGRWCVDLALPPIVAPGPDDR